MDHETFLFSLRYNTLTFSPSSSCLMLAKYVDDCDGVVLVIYLDHKFQWPQEGLDCESLAYEVVT